MEKLTLLTIFLLVKLIAHTQLESVRLENIQSCNSATLIALPIWGAGSIVHPVTLNYEKQIGTNWFTVVSQVYDYQSNYIIVYPTDISSATFYRVRALDMVTLEERISAGATVNPATWNVDRDNAFFTGVSYWGNLCDNTQNYLQVSAFYSAHGRPPFTIEYKKQNEANYTVAGTVTAGTQIYGIAPFVGYNVRITDFCGKVNTVNVNGLQILAAPTILQNATTCNNGRISVSQIGGIGPYTYALGKVVTGNELPPMNFGTTSVFDNLAPGDYYAWVKDACGNITIHTPVRLGGGFPRIFNQGTSIPADSCLRNIIIGTSSGTTPMEYGIRHISDTTFTWQSSNVFTNLNRVGIYFFRAKDVCGQLSDSIGTGLSFPTARVDSVRRLGNTCVKDLKVFASGGYKPYQYGFRKQFSGAFVYQVSDTFKNITPGIHQISVIDRCGRESSFFTIDETSAVCSLRTTAGDFESANSGIGCINITGNNWIDLKDDNSQLLFSINPRNNVINNVCYGIRVVNNTGGLRSGLINSSITYFLDRNFYIEPQQPVTLINPVSVRVYFTSTELDDMLSYLSTVYGGIITISNLRILKKKGPSVDLDVTNDGGASSSQFTVIQPRFGTYDPDWYMEFDVVDFSEFNPFGAPLTPLPLKLVSFSASLLNNATHLRWTTTNEEEMKEFVIEWSRNGISYESIGVMTAKNLSTNTSYSFVHASPADGKNFYRLKIIDRDNKEQYSPVAWVMMGREQKLICAPNPVNGVMNIALPQTARYQWLRIVDVQGRIVAQKKISANQQNVQWNVQNLVAGNYLLQAIGNEMVQTVFVKQ